MFNGIFDAPWCDDEVENAGPWPLSQEELLQYKTPSDRAKATRERERYS